MIHAEVAPEKAIFFADLTALQEQIASETGNAKITIEVLVIDHRGKAFGAAGSNQFCPGTFV